MNQVVWLVVLAIASLAAGCVTDKQVISQAEDANKGLAPAVMNDPDLSSYIQQIGNRVIATAQQLDRQGYSPGGHRKEDSSWMYQGMEFHLVNSATLNAFTTGGHHMYIYSELFQSCKNEDELAAVMSHEYAHVYCRHVAQGMMQKEVLSGTAAGASALGYAAGGQEKGSEYSSVAANAAMQAGQFIGMGFTRKDEDQADGVGFQFYCRAGWDPNQFAGFFRTMISKGYDKTPELMSDHPKLVNRVEATEQRIQELPPEARTWRKPQIADDRHFKALQARASQIAKTTRNDQSLKQAQLMLAAFPSCVSPEDQPAQKQAQAIIYQAAQMQQKK